jgi:hypothetical protein
MKLKDLILYTLGLLHLKPYVSCEHILSTLWLTTFHISIVCENAGTSKGKPCDSIEFYLCRT